MNQKKISIPSIQQINNDIYLLKLTTCLLCLTLVTAILKLTASIKFINMVSWLIIVGTIILSMVLFFIRYYLLEAKLVKKYENAIGTVPFGLRSEQAWDLYEKELDIIKKDRIKTIEKTGQWLRTTNLCSDGVAPIVGWRKLI